MNLDGLKSNWKFDLAALLLSSLGTARYIQHETC